MKVLTIAAALMLTAGCGQSTPKAPPTQSVTVTLVDTVPLALLYGGPGGSCQSTNSLAEAFGESTAPVTVTLSDAKGEALRTLTLPKAGGTFEAKTCTWPVDMGRVPKSAVYKVEVRRGQDAPITGEGGGPTVRVEF